jgi:AraC family transcriptional regulator, melibiose operon regulatory protein
MPGLSPNRPNSFDPNRPDFAPYGLTCVRWWPSPMRRPDHHNEVELNFLSSGSLTYLLGGSKTTVTAGKLGVFWAAIPHQIIGWGTAASYHVVTIPLQCFLQWRLPEHFVQPLMQGRLVSEPDDARASSDAQLLEHWEADLGSGRTELERPVLLEMQARLLRLALALPKNEARATKRDRLRTLTATGLNKVEQMACFIAQNYTEKLTVAQIGESAGLHPNYAMNLFQKTFGTTLIAYLTQHRISHAQRLLATTADSVAEIAFESGFNSLSRFNDAFRRSCGCSPREYRRTHLLTDGPGRATTAPR